MSTNLRTRLSTQHLSELQHLSSLLHLFHHRNHNQHRRSPWYRHFSIFRRQLTRLTDAYAELSRIPDTQLGKHRKKAADQQTLAAIQQRLEFWRDVVIPKAQHGFSQVAADGRFAVLGVFLLAVLGQICAVTGIVSEYEDLAQEEVERVLQQFADEEWGGSGRGGGAGGGGGVTNGDGKGRAGGNLAMVEDVGEVVTRERSADSSREPSRKASPAVESQRLSGVEVDLNHPQQEEPFVMEDKEQSPVSSSETPSRPTSETPQLERAAKRHKTTISKLVKKKKKRNAIDDLFSGL